MKLHFKATENVCVGIGLDPRKLPMCLVFHILWKHLEVNQCRFCGLPFFIMRIVFYYVSVEWRIIILEKIVFARLIVFCQT